MSLLCRDPGLLRFSIVLGDSWKKDSILLKSASIYLIPARKCSISASNCPILESKTGWTLNLR